MKRRDPVRDVIVLGAGAAGLSAAAELCAAGLGVTVLEARDRIGGRVHTLHEDRCPHPVELGAEFVHGRPEEVFEIVRRANLLVCDADGEHWHLERGRLRKVEDAWEQIGDVLERLAKAFPPRGTRDETFDQFLRHNRNSIKGRPRELATLFVEGFNATPAGRVSARWLADGQRAENLGGAEEQFRLPGGYDRVLRHLAARITGRCDIRLRHVVRSVQWRGSSTTVSASTPDGVALPPLSARTVLVTLPLGVLKSGGPTFDPPLPPAKRGAIDRLEMGSVVKVVLQFREPFWELRQLRSTARGERLNAMAFLHSRDEPFPTWWTWHPLRAPTLTGWAGGPAAEALAGQSNAEIYGQALASLGRFLGLAADELDALVERQWVADWKSDEYARGAYSYVPAGATDAVRRLAAAVGETLFFAGEATEPAGHSGTVSGAVASGRRAAREVVAALRGG